MPSLSLPPHAVDVLLLFAENEQLLTLTAQVQWSLVLVQGNFAIAENTELTRSSAQQFSLLSGKLEQLMAENTNLKHQIAMNAELQCQSAENEELQLQVADLTNKLGSAEADLQECIQDSKQMMQSIKNMQPSVLWSFLSVHSSGALSCDKD